MSKATPRTLFLDAEYNGFGGDLISMALVPFRESLPEFYEAIEIAGGIHPWVRENVIPVMGSVVPVSSDVFRTRLEQYLSRISQGYPLKIVADWPEDFVHLNRALVTGPGQRMHLPTRSLQMSLILGLSTNPAVPHNALSDARALRYAYAKSLMKKNAAA